MGGANPTIKPFFLYPDSRYAGQKVEYFIQLDETEYPTEYRYYKDGIMRVAVSPDDTC
jgi:hypothetical protein